MRIRKVCVIGSGTMGGGIAQVCARAGYETTMVDMKQEYVDRGMKMISTSLARFVEKGKMKQEEMDAAMGRLRTSIDVRDASRDSDFAIEAVFERADVKRPIFSELDGSCPEHAILASNTSGIPISLLASATGRPDKVIGTHFMNPVPLMKGVEIVRSLLTSDETLDVSVEFVQSLGKETVVVKDAPGFVTNRIVTLVMNEAARLLEEDLASVEDIDKIEKLSHNWPMGPFELADLVGIDVVVDLLEGIYQQTGWERYKPAPLLKRMVEIGYTGRKAGKGFYQLFAKEK